MSPLKKQHGISWDDQEKIMRTFQMCLLSYILVLAFKALKFWRSVIQFCEVSSSLGVKPFDKKWNLWNFQR